MFVDFFIFMYVLHHCFICHPSDFTVSEHAGIERRTVATCDFGIDGQPDVLTTRLDLIQNKKTKCASDLSR
jgi:hypothetical protein